MRQKSEMRVDMGRDTRTMSRRDLEAVVFDHIMAENAIHMARADVCAQ